MSAEAFFFFQFIFSRVSAFFFGGCFFGCFCAFLGVFLCFLGAFFVFRALARFFFGFFFGVARIFFRAKPSKAGNSLPAPARRGRPLSLRPGTRTLD